MRHFALSAIGQDRPGIVAAVTERLLEHELNVEDSQMTILRGQFTMMLVVSAGEDVDADALRSGLEDTGRELGLAAVSLSEVSGAEGTDDSEPSHIVTVYGVDHPGIVHAVASSLAGGNVNITDVNTRLVTDEDGEDLYAMMLEVALPPGTSADSLEGLLEATRQDQGVEVSIRELEQDAL